WQAARRLVEWGAQTTFWTAAALGLLDRVAAYFNREVLSPEIVTNGFWHACHGGQRATAEYLADRGADIDWVGYDEMTPLDAARRNGSVEVMTWLDDRGASSAEQLRIKAGTD
ncbi:MAG: ankyrin repeat domain-containing protein, partial [Deltaproteobacteria bacterium]|nr:ankyrin repeat domain-containing protein [Deltaproteobacteria bacterium]